MKTISPRLILVLYVLMSFPCASFAVKMKRPTQEQPIVYPSAVDSLWRLIDAKPVDSILYQHYYDVSMAILNVDRDSAIVVLNRALEYFKTKKNDKAVGTFLRKLGTVYHRMSDYNTALDYYFQALKAFEGTNDWRGRAWCYNNIGNLYSDKYTFTSSPADLDQSIDFTNKALQLFIDNKGEKDMGAILNNYALRLMMKKEYKKAILEFEKCAKIFEDVNDVNGISMVASNLGDCYLEMGESTGDFNMYSKALGYYDKVIKLVGGDNFSPRNAQVLNSLARIQIHMGLLEKAKQYLDRSLAIAETVNDKEIIPECYRILTLYYEKKGDLSNAFKAQKKYLAYKDSLMTMDNIKNLNQMQSLFDKEKQQKEIELLKKDKDIQELENANNQADLRRKNLILFTTIAVTILLFILALLLINRNQIRKKANAELMGAYDLIKIQNQNITHSINYAKRIQDAFVTDKEKLNQLLLDSGIIYRPRDIVSGDFCWTAEVDGKKVLVVTDCTGHGVPGAFMSMIGNTLLKEIVVQKKILRPGEVLRKMNSGIIQALNQKKSDINTQADGMDMSVCIIDASAGKLDFASANQSLLIGKKGKAEIIYGDYYSVGGIFTDSNVDFVSHHVPMDKDSIFCLFTDGIIDQFGGTDDKKFSFSRLETLVGKASSSSAAEACSLIEREFTEWKGEARQTDDVLLVVFKV